MPRPPHVPVELTSSAFTVTDALRAGLTRRQLQGRSWRRIATGIYVWTGLGDNPMNLLRALSTHLPPEAAFSDRAAAWLHGLELELCQPIEVALPDGCGVSSRSGVVIRRTALPRSEIVECRGLPATSPIRTVFDLARHRRIAEAVVAIDTALRNAMVGLGELRDYVNAHPTAKGVAQVRRAVDLAEPRSESPMESRLRMLLVLAGLPRPQAQAELADEQGRFLGRVDLYFAAQRLALEYDGGNHRESLVTDNRRQNRLLAAGFRLLRFTAADLYNRPDDIVAQVRDALRPPKR